MMQRYTLQRAFPRHLQTLPAIVALGCAGLASACGTELTTTRVASGLSSPVFVTAPPGDFDRLFIVQQTGSIRILDLTSGTLNATPFLQITVTGGGERGLLGLAFDPNYAQNGYFYVNYTRNVSGSLTTHVSRFKRSLNPDVADSTSELVMLRIAQPYGNHNGGWIAFGPDGYLYVATGDGGLGGDPDDRSQDITNELLGKMLRIDVNGDDFPVDPNRNYAIPVDNPFVGITGDDEIWAYGLRNPWRNAFDRETGDLYIADVGQGAWEEINFQPADSIGGENYGWRCYEGLAEFDDTGCAPAASMVFPFQTYARGGFPFRCSITGGCVYRGEAIWDLRGTYFYADYCSDQIWSLRYDGVSMSDFEDRTAELDPPLYSINSVVSFGEDAAGELYICDLGGEVFKIIPSGPVLGDMNGDGAIDFDDIDPFVLGLTDPDSFEDAYGYLPTVPGDLDCNDAFDLDDIDPFVAALGM